MSLLYDERPVPTYVRTRVGIPLPRIEFGAPSSKLEEPGGYRYEISESDRRVLEQAIRDTQSGDYLREQAAIGVLKVALAAVVPGIGGLLGIGAEVILNFLGYGVRTEFTDSSVPSRYGGISIGGYQCGGAACDESARMAVTEFSFCPLRDGNDRVSMKGVILPKGYNVRKISAGLWRAYMYTGVAGFQVEYSGNFRTYLLIGGELRRDYSFDPGCGKLAELPTSDDQSGSAGYTGGAASGRVRWLIRNYDATCSTPADFYYGNWIDWTRDGNCRDAGDFGDFNTGLWDELPGFDPGQSDYSFSPVEVREEFIPRLRDSEWWEKYGEPFEGEHPKNPNWPCLPSGPQPPGGEVPRVRVGGPGMRVPRPPGFDPPGKPGDEMCVVIGGKRHCGRIRRMPPPGEDIIIEEPPYRDERFTKHWCPKKGRLIVDLVKQLAEELGFSPGDVGWIVDTDCKKRWPGGCFKKGSSKFKAMWALADMCGDIFDQEPPHIGKIKPLPPDPRTYGPYHEYRDLFVFEAVQDDLDIPSHVEVYVPHFRNRRGYSVVVPVDTPYNLKDKWLRIRAPKSMSEADAMDWAAKKARQFEITTNLVDFAIPYEQGQYVKKRTQLKLRIPSEGYDGRFMVWEHSHDIDIEEGAATKVRGVRLSETRYAPRFESYSEVWSDDAASWANAGIMR